MRTAAKLAVSILVVAAATAMEYRLLYLPYRCNSIQRRARARTTALARAPIQMGTVAVARRQIELLSWCRCSPEKVDTYLIRASYFRLMDRFPEAIAEYETALRYERRPDIYLFLGETQIEAGMDQAGMSNLRRAIEFNPKLVEWISRPDLRMRAGELLEARN